MKNLNAHRHYQNGRPGRVWNQEEDKILRAVYKEMGGEHGWMVVAFNTLTMLDGVHDLNVHHVRRRAEKLGLKSNRFKTDSSKGGREQLAQAAVRADWEKTNNLILRKPWGALCPIYRSCV